MTIKVTKANLAESKRLHKKAQEAYYNSEPIMTDAQFDQLEDDIRKIAPTWSGLRKTGVATKHKKEVKHEHFMPSLSKAYPEDQPKFLRKYKATSYIAMAKADGTSLALTYEKGVPKKLATRGDGVTGGDVSHFIPFLVENELIPARIAPKATTTLRIEGVMYSKMFAKKWASKYENARNLVNGLFNRQKPTEELKDAKLLVLGVFGMHIESGLTWAHDMGFETIPHCIVKADFAADMTMDWARRTWSQFEIDGVVITTRDFYYEYDDAEKPKGIWAYKENDLNNAHVCIVKDVQWMKSRTGRWTPKIFIEPTRMDGVTVTRATAHNGHWVTHRKIGPGATVQVLRSGGVIPKIVGIVKGVTEKQMKYPEGEWKWDGKFIVDTEQTAREKVRAIHFFLTTMGVEFLAEKSIEKCFDAGVMTSMGSIVTRIVGSDKPLRRVIEALGVANAKKSHASIQAAFESFNVKKLMIATGLMGIGIGEKHLLKLEKYGIMMYDTQVQDASKLRHRIMMVPGIKDKTADKLVAGFAAFSKWFEQYSHALEGRVQWGRDQKKQSRTGMLTGEQVAWTGYRDAKQEELVESFGGVVDKLKASTTILLYNPNGKFMDKVTKARDKGVTCLTWPEFVKKYKFKE